MKVSELGEFGLIRLLSDIVDKTRNSKAVSWQSLLIGIGDDAAAWKEKDAIHLATTDSLVQGTHFDLDITSWEDLGWKAIAVNLSDIAAMGGIPKYALISLALPGELQTECITSLYQGMTQIANQHGVAIVGGNIASANETIITVSLLGSLNSKHPLTRSAAVLGDQIAVTGYLGVSAAGLNMLKRKLRFDAESSYFLTQSHLRPVPRVSEGQTLLRLGVKAAIDVSDGLVADLNHMCEKSKVSARIEKDLLPIHPAVRANFKTDYVQLALSGGEDYELLFAGSSQLIDRVKKAISCPVTIIGEITGGVPAVSIIDSAGREIPLQESGWEHFKSQS